MLTMYYPCSSSTSSSSDSSSSKDKCETMYDLANEIKRQKMIDYNK